MAPFRRSRPTRPVSRPPRTGARRPPRPDRTAPREVAPDDAEPVEPEAPAKAPDLESPERPGEPAPEAPVEGAPGRPALHAAVIWCDACGEETAHRVLRLEAPARRGTGPVRGVARCRVCRLTHRFEVVPRPMTAVAAVVSEGARSARTQVQLPASARLTVNERLAVLPGPYRIRRIERKDGSVGPSAPAGSVATVWVVRESEPGIRVAIVDGARTRTAQVVLPPASMLGVGDPVTVEGTALVVAAIRARARTWRRVGDRFAVAEIDRIYARRTVRPPAGSNDWSRSRGRPSARESSISRSARFRSSPGRRRYRTSPRAASADGGATVHRRSPSRSTSPTASSSGRSSRTFLVPWITQAPRATYSPLAPAFDT